MSEQQKNVITIDGKEYAEDQLTKKQKILLDHIVDLDRKIASAEFSLDQLLVGRDAFVNMLTASLTNETEIDNVY
jgi:hypothetical protein